MDILPNSREQVLRENAYGLGDNWEVKNAEKNECTSMQSDYDNYKRLFYGRFVNGNHEMTEELPNLIVDGHILLTHGDYPMEGIVKANEFRNGPKRCAGSGFIQKAIANNHEPISASDAKKLSDYARYYQGVDVIVVGHRHPASRFDQVINGIRVIGLPRGKTSLSL